MLAADCSRLPSNLRHLIHVMALHADNTSGRGLTGQAALGRYLGVSGRHVRRLLTELESLWEGGLSPVGVLRNKRWLNSDAYTIVVRPEAPLALTPGSRVDRTTVSANERITMSTNDRTRLSNRADTVVRVPPNEADTDVLQPSEVSLQREPQSKAQSLPRAYASGAPPHATAEAKTTEADRAWDAGVLGPSTTRAEGPRGGVDSSEPPSVFAIAAARRRARKLEREQRSG